MAPDVHVERPPSGEVARGPASDAGGPVRSNVWFGRMRSDLSQWTEKADDASDSLAVRGKLGDIEAIG